MEEGQSFGITVPRELKRSIWPTIVSRWHPLSATALSSLHKGLLFCLSLWSLTIWYKCLLLLCRLVKGKISLVFFLLVCNFMTFLGPGNVRLDSGLSFRASSGLCHLMFISPPRISTVEVKRISLSFFLRIPSGKEAVSPLILYQTYLRGFYYDFFPVEVNREGRIYIPLTYIQPTCNDFSSSSSFLPQLGKFSIIRAEEELPR